MSASSVGIGKREAEDSMSQRRHGEGWPAMADEKTIYVHTPVVASAASEASAVSIPDLRGKTVGFIGNGFSNAHIVLERLKEVLQERFQIGRVVWRGELPPGILPKAQEGVLYQEMASLCDVVVTGVGS